MTPGACPVPQSRIGPDLKDLAAGMTIPGRDGDPGPDRRRVCQEGLELCNRPIATAVAEF